VVEGMAVKRRRVSDDRGLSASEEVASTMRKQQVESIRRSRTKKIAMKT
jgi:hypothetical protein